MLDNELQLAKVNQEFKFVYTISSQIVLIYYQKDEIFWHDHKLYLLRCSEMKNVRFSLQAK